MTTADICSRRSVLARPKTCRVSLLMKFIDTAAPPYKKAEPNAMAALTGRRMLTCFRVSCNFSSNTVQKTYRSRHVQAVSACCMRLKWYFDKLNRKSLGQQGSELIDARLSTFWLYEQCKPGQIKVVTSLLGFVCRPLEPCNPTAIIPVQT